MRILRLLTIVIFLSISQISLWWLDAPLSDILFWVIFWSIFILAILVWLYFDIFNDTALVRDDWSTRWRKPTNLWKTSIKVKTETEKIIRKCVYCESKNSTFKRIKSFKHWWDNQVYLECSDCKSRIIYNVDEIRDQITKKQVLITLAINIVLIISLLNWFSAGRKADFVDNEMRMFCNSSFVKEIIESYPKNIDDVKNIEDMDKYHLYLELDEIIKICEK